MFKLRSSAGLSALSLRWFRFLSIIGKKRRDEVNERKFAYYKELMEAISGLAINPADVMAVKRFAHASNTIGLIAPQAVILALTAFQEELKKPSQDFSINQQNTLMNALLLELRHSLGIRGDKPEYFAFHLTNVVVNAKKSS